MQIGMFNKRAKFPNGIFVCFLFFKTLSGYFLDSFSSSLEPFCCSFPANRELFPRTQRNAEPQSGVDQVTTEQSFFLNTSIYP